MHKICDGSKELLMVSWLIFTPCRLFSFIATMMFRLIDNAFDCSKSAQIVSEYGIYFHPCAHQVQHIETNLNLD